MHLYITDIKKTLFLSLPIIVGQLGQILMSVVDNVMVGKLGADALAASSIANAIFTLIMVVGFGISMAATPLTAIAYGAGRDRECGVILHQGLVVNMVFALLLCGVTIGLSECIVYLNQPDEIVGPASIYLKVLVVFLSF